MIHCLIGFDEAVATIRRCRLLIGLILTCFNAIGVVAVAGEEGGVRNDRFYQQRQLLESDFAMQIARLSAELRTTGLEQPALELQRFAIPRDPQRQYIFLPAERLMKESALANGLPDKLHRAATALLNGHADALAQLAKTQAAGGDAASAFQLLHEVLFFNPDHAEARRILGHRLIDRDGQRRWQIQPDRFRIKRGAKPQERFGWPPQTYYVASTSNFLIESTATEDQIRLLAERLERWHDVWRQVCFEFYGRSENLNRWIDGKGTPPLSSRKYKVNFFADQNQYIQHLRSTIQGVEASTGYYSDADKVAYFFASSDPSIHETWIHELTHQLFQESQKSVRSPFKDGFLWLGEGIAMYFESIVDQGDYVTLGGFDSRRLQYARLRRIKEQFAVPLAELSHLDQTQFQTSPDLAKVYSQAAGLTHYLMGVADGRLRQPLMEFLQLSYRGRLKPEAFEQLLGRDFARMEQEYLAFLHVDGEQLQYLSAPEQRRELFLVGAALQDDSLLPLGRCQNLQWLDLSGCDLRGSRLQPVSHCGELRQLFVTGSKLDATAVELIAGFPITGLDAGGTDFDDAMTESLSASPTIRQLNLDATPLSDGGLMSLTKMRALTLLSAANTRVTPDGARRFANQRPDVQTNTVDGSEK